MADNKRIRNIKSNYERVIQGLITGLKQFYYVDTGVYVKPDTTYSVYYTPSKKSIYLTGTISNSNSREIKSLSKPTLFEEYSKLTSLTKDVYPRPIIPQPSKSDYSVGTMTRYIAVKANNPTDKIIEISEDDFNSKNSLFKYTSFMWRVSGKKTDVSIENKKTITRLVKEYSNITDLLFPLQYWKPSDNTSDSVEKKLSLLKKT